ncbi:hypothetical protein LTR50_006480 [Elasticomyces elasticus]|nr:hypothetical protein LTR50_006480 [Elasticomyces elasticus]
MAPIKIEDDPVLTEYDVFITPNLAEQIYLLQYPNRGRAQPYNERNGARPVEMRIKPGTGFLEMDVSLNTNANFNKHQGLKWGKAVKKAKAQGIHSFGLAAGLNADPFRKRDADQKEGEDQIKDEDQKDGADQKENAYDDDPIEDGMDELMRFDLEAAEGNVMSRQTLGGQILDDEPGMPVYMLGAFRGRELHLSKVDGIIQMRPQYHHIDAATLTQKNAARLEREREAGEAPRPTDPRGVQMSYKESGEQADEDSDKEDPSIAQEEPWTKLVYRDEDEDESYIAYRDKLFVKDINGAARLVSDMTNEAYLEAYSMLSKDSGGRKKKKPSTKKQVVAVELDENEIGQAEQEHIAAG